MNLPVLAGSSKKRLFCSSAITCNANPKTQLIKARRSQFERLNLSSKEQQFSEEDEEEEEEEEDVVTGVGSRVDGYEFSK